MLLFVPLNSESLVYLLTEDQTCPSPEMALLTPLAENPIEELVSGL